MQIMTYQDRHGQWWARADRQAPHGRVRVWAADSNEMGAAESAWQGAWHVTHGDRVMVIDGDDMRLVRLLPGQNPHEVA
jgi:hypothetical protein